MHVSNIDSKDIYLVPPKLLKIYAVMYDHNRKFKNLCTPDQNISADESFDNMEREAFIQTVHSIEAIENWN
jgi:hypothetical protein